MPPAANMADAKLNPAALSFSPEQLATTPCIEEPPKPPPDPASAPKEDTAFKQFDTYSLPEWMLVDESEKLLVTALSLAKTASRHEWIARLRRYAELLVPGVRLGSSRQGNLSATSEAVWTPLAIRQMPSPPKPDFSKPDVTFSFDFIQGKLRGAEWSPGFYFIHPKDRREGSKITAYWVLDAAIDPFVPQAPGQHGAKLTPFFNTTASSPGGSPAEKDYVNVPVFIGKNHKCGYRYFGHYSQTRYSDKLDYERMLDGTVPPFILDVWAKLLSSRSLQPWMKNALREHVWPRPAYHGPHLLTQGSESLDSHASRPPMSEEQSRANDRRVRKAIQEYSKKLEEWDAESRLKVEMLTEANIHQLFRAADIDDPAGLRFWFEYLQCTSYNSTFYEYLVELKCNECLQRNYAENVQEREKQGWTWQLFEKMSGSGHVYSTVELRPPPATVAVRRTDSVIGCRQSSSRSGENEVERKQEDDSSLEEKTFFGEEWSAATPSLTEKPAQDAPPAPRCPEAILPSHAQTQNLPPHLRAMRSEPAPTSNANSNTSANTITAAPSNPSPSSNLESAKRLAVRFPKTKSQG